MGLVLYRAVSWCFGLERGLNWSFVRAQEMLRLLDGKHVKLLPVTQVLWQEQWINHAWLQQLLDDLLVPVTLSRELGHEIIRFILLVEHLLVGQLYIRIQALSELDQVGTVLLELPLDFPHWFLYILTLVVNSFYFLNGLTALVIDFLQILKADIFQLMELAGKMAVLVFYFPFNLCFEQDTNPVNICVNHFLDLAELYWRKAICSLILYLRSGLIDSLQLYLPLLS